MAKLHLQRRGAGPCVQRPRNYPSRCLPVSDAGRAGRDRQRRRHLSGRELHHAGRVQRERGRRDPRHPWRDRQQHHARHGDLVLDFCQSDAANQDWTVGAGQTLIYEIVDATSNEKSAASYESAVGTTTVMSYTLSVSNGWTLFACSVTGASGGGASNVPFVG